MGSSGEDPSKVIDGFVGGLVWVRRRNGSWWPGRIISPNELPEGCMPTPRSGTPVKLLGREDASVDWYNLEKSKRVKPFRCGEYDDCIEKAKASALYLSKKTVKYARREDAILHALDLESSFLGQDQHDHHYDDSPCPSHPTEENKHIEEDLNSSKNDSDSGPELPDSGVSFEEPDYVNSIKGECEKDQSLNDSEDDGTEGVKRMRGLEDLGMGVATAKRKRSQVAHVQEFLKRKNRRRALTKVLECTAMVSVPVVCEQLTSPIEPSDSGASENRVLGVDCKELKDNNLHMANNSDNKGVSCENATFLNEIRESSGALPISGQKENETFSTLEGIPDRESFESLFDVPLVAEVKTSAGLASIVSAAPSSRSSPIGTFTLEIEEQNDCNSTGSGTTDLHSISHAIADGSSKWQLKGKRNSRSRKIDMDDDSETHLAGISCHRVGGPLITDSDINHLDSRPNKESQVEEFRGWSWNSHLIETPAKPQRMLPYRQSRLTINPKYDSSDFLLNRQTTDSGLYDVTVEVKTNERPRHVPYISLMSKLNRRPIVGHPLPVEVLTEGFCDDLLIVSGYYTEVDYNLNDLSPSRGVGNRKLQAQTKSPKTRKNGVLCKKTKKLSSLSGEEKKPVVDKLKGPSIACVPLNVVFSRINAALKNSMRSAPLLSSA